MLLQTTQVLTLTGAGGIGKTSLAIEVARQASNDSSRAVCFVELATATTEDAVLCEVAEACGLSTLDAAVDVAQLAAAVSGKRLLLVLDNAEHVIDAVARIVDALVAASEILRVMVTSREPLRLMQETVYRVEPFDVPPSHSTHAEIVQFSAVKLFLLRVNSIQRYAYAGCEEIHLIGEICRRLDGIPLAIELAATRVAGLGIGGVHRYLHDRFSLLTGGYWAFSQHGDTRIGVELAAGFTEALLDAGLIHECCTRAEQAIDALEELPHASVDSDTEMRVRATLASALIYAHGPVSKSAQSWREVLALAGDTGDGSGANSEGESVKVLPPDLIIRQ
ncbi:ATP-binding protein [Paraburkholderia sp. MM5477-R1]|uniref:ATP-binding protein n=1 Tax=Paraburkholderia sp. MM5477-R1 TaxID=2991062 RepID=UPI003D1F5E7C